jgi:hypothetical protein
MASMPGSNLGGKGKALAREQTEDALVRAENLTSGRRLSMMERQTQWEEKKAQKAARLLAEKEERENSECSFVPKLKAKKPQRRPSLSAELPAITSPTNSGGGLPVMAQIKEKGVRVTTDAKRTTADDGKRKGAKRRNTWTAAAQAAAMSKAVQMQKVDEEKNDKPKEKKLNKQRRASINVLGAVAKLKAGGEKKGGGGKKRRPSMMKIQLASEVAGTSRLEDEIEALRQMKRNLDEQAKAKENAVLAVEQAEEAEKAKDELAQQDAATVLQSKMRQRVAKKEVGAKKQAVEDAREVLVRVRITGGGYSGKTGMYTCMGLLVFVGFDPAAKYEITLDENAKVIFKKGSQLEKRADDDLDVEVVERKKSVFLMEEEAEEERAQVIAAAKAKKEAEEKAAREAAEKQAAEDFYNSDEQKALREINHRNELRQKVADSGGDEVAGANKKKDWEAWRNGGKLKGRSDK